jgi:hypothetical protein
MSFASFNKLVHKLHPFMKQCDHSKSTSNGPIFHSIQVACAIRYFAGGSPYDIATTFGIAVSEVFESVWDVVDAVNNHPDFEIRYPDSHDEQRRIASRMVSYVPPGFLRPAWFFTSRLKPV